MKATRFSLAGLIASTLVGALSGALFFLLVLKQDSNLVRVTDSEAAILDVYRTLESHYIEEIGTEELANRAIDGMFRELDYQSEHFVGDAVSDIHSYASSQFGGVGIQVALVGDSIRVISAIIGKPAEMAGLRSGDRILAIDDISTERRTLREVVDALRGPIGSSVILTFQQRTTGKIVRVVLVRAEITNDSVEFRMDESGLAILQISEFLDNTADLVHDQLSSSEDLEGLVIDLRGNPGGLFEVAIQLADFFLSSGVIVRIESRDSASPLEYLATTDELLPETKLVVLIDNDTASAAELFAGALQDHKRATLLGQSTYGKGTIQSVIPIGEDRAIKLTTGRYVLPKGRRIGETGVQPDIEIANSNPETAAIAILKTNSNP